MISISERIHNIQQQIASTARSSQTVQILAVSKGQTREAILQAYAAGIRDFGESYLQEALPKIASLATLPLTWHFLGPIQSNKTKAIAAHFSWVHSVSRLQIAERLNQQRPLTLPPLNICIQINLDGEATKSGIQPTEALALAQSIQQLPHLKLRGLMCIPQKISATTKQYDIFLQLYYLQQQLNQQLELSLDTLSMGMSDDFTIALQAGSTLIRLGQAIFGQRPS